MKGTLSFSIPGRDGLLQRGLQSLPQSFYCFCIEVFLRIRRECRHFPRRICGRNMRIESYFTLKEEPWPRGQTIGAAARLVQPGRNNCQDELKASKSAQGGETMCVDRPDAVR